MPSQDLSLALKKYKAVIKRKHTGDEWYVVSNEVMQIIHIHKDYLSFEAIIEAITQMGGAPSLLYDDNGYFAVVEDGIQAVRTKPEKDFAGEWFCKKSAWKRSVREALYYYLRQK